MSRRPRKRTTVTVRAAEPFTEFKVAGFTFVSRKMVVVFRLTDRVRKAGKRMPLDAKARD
jgi:hypothetical protein